MVNLTLASIKHDTSISIYNILVVSPCKLCVHITGLHATQVQCTISVPAILNEATMHSVQFILDITF